MLFAKDKPVLTRNLQILASVKPAQLWKISFGARIKRPPKMVGGVGQCLTLIKYEIFQIRAGPL